MRPGAFPHDLAVLQVVAAQAIHAGNDHLRPAFVFDNQWRRPRIDLVAIDAPEFFARPLIECDDKRLAALLVPNDDKTVAIQRRRASLAELIAHPLVAEVFVPEKFAIHREGVQPLGFEERKEMLAVGDCGAGSPGPVVDMRAFVRHFLANRAFPGDLAVLAVDGHHDKSMSNARLNDPSRGSADASPVTPTGTAVMR